jgi:hypothetical protein
VRDTGGDEPPLRGSPVPTTGVVRPKSGPELSPFARQEPLHRTRILPKPRRLRRFSTSDTRFDLFNI